LWQKILIKQLNGYLKATHSGNIAEYRIHASRQQMKPMERCNMAFDAFTKKRLEKTLDNYIDKKIPGYLKAEYKIIYKFRGDTITLSQERPSFRPGHRVELPIAQFRYDDGKWKVYWKDSKDKWHFVEDINPTNDFETQLKMIDKAEFGYMWM